MKNAGLLVLFFLSFRLNSQTTPLDSLLYSLNQAQEDTQKVKLLNLIARHYAYVNPGQSRKYLTDAIALSEKLSWTKGQAQSYAELGIHHAGQFEHTEALQYNFKALKIFIELGDKDGAAGVLANISQLYKTVGNYPKALDYAFQAIGLNEQHIDKGKLAIMLENIGTLYLEQKNYSKTMEYYEKALHIYEERGDKMGMARNLGNTGIVHDAQGNYTKALDFHLRALEQNESLKNEHTIEINLANIGYVYYHLRDFAKAVEYQVRALTLSQRLKKKGSIAINLGNLGETFFAIASEGEGKKWANEMIPVGKQEQLQHSIQYLQDAVDLCKEIRFAAPQAEFTRFLSDAYALAGDFKKAMRLLKEYNILSDSIYSEQKKIEFAALESKRALDLKNQEIIIKNNELEIIKLQAANKKNERILYIIGLVLLLVVTLLLISKMAKGIKTHRKVLTDISQIQSHQVRAPVARILGLSEMLNQTDPNDPENKKLIMYIQQSSRELDNVIQKIVHKTRSKGSSS